jgi:hypothetical protein
MHKDKHIRIRGERRDQPDIRKLSRAVIALAQAQAEKEAEAVHAAKQKAAAKRIPKPRKKAS